jgi:hypothetical protein
LILSPLGATRGKEILLAFGALALLTCLLFLPALAPGTVFYFRDLCLNHHPYRQLTLSMISAGELPLWNPLRGAGQPLMANPNALVLHPTTLLFFLLPFEAAFKISVIAQIFLAGAGAWLLLRDEGASRAAASLGAGIFAFSGYMVSLGNLLNLLNSAAFMPLTLWLAGRAVRRGFTPWGSLAALSLAVQVIAGEPAILLCTAAAFVAMHWSPESGGETMPVRPLKARAASASGVVLLALAVSMVAILPTTELLVRSERGAGFDREEALKWSLPPVGLLETAVAHLFGDPTRSDIGKYWGASHFDAGLPFILSVYLGPAALILAGMGLITGVRAGGRRRAAAIALGCLAVGGIALALGRFLPLYPALVSMLPPLHSIRYPVKYFLVVTWAVAILAARGYDGVMTQSGSTRSARRGVSISLSCGVAFGALGLALAGGHNGSLVTSIARGALLIAATGSLLVLRSPRAAGLGLLALPLVDLIAANAGLNPVAPADFYITPPALSRILGAPGEGRIWAAPRPVGFAFRRHEADEPDSLRWGFLWDRMTLRNATYFTTGYRFAWDRGNERLDVMPGAAIGKLLYEGAGSSMPPAQTARLLSVAGVDRLITYGGLSAPGLSEGARLEGESRPPVVVMRSDKALPRAYVVSRIEIHPDILRAAKRLREPSFDPRATVILEEGSSPAGASDAGAADAAQARILADRPTRVTVESSSPGPGYLVLADTFYPGWKATVDGEEKPILRANTMFRAVMVPGGTHRVEFIYQPSSVRSGLMVTAAGLLLAGLFAVPRRR